MGSSSFLSPPCYLRFLNCWMRELLQTSIQLGLISFIIYMISPLYLNALQPFGLYPLISIMPSRFCWHQSLLLIVMVSLIHTSSMIASYFPDADLEEAHHGGLGPSISPTLSMLTSLTSFYKRTVACTWTFHVDMDLCLLSHISLNWFCSLPF